MVFTRMSLPVAKHASSVLSLESTRVNLRAHYYFSLARVGIFFSRARDHHRTGQSLTPHSLKISYRSPNFTSIPLVTLVGLEKVSENIDKNATNI